MPCRLNPLDRSRCIPGAVPELVGVEISDIACGDNHMVVVDKSNGALYTFGKARHGACPLGHGDWLGPSQQQQSSVGDKHTPELVAVPRRDCLGACFKGFPQAAVARGEQRV